MEGQTQRKKVLFMRGYFFPESAASNKMCQELIDVMADSGLSVELICPIPTRGVTDEVRKSYSEKKIQKPADHIVIRRYWLPKEGKRTVVRAARYLMQNFYQFFYALFHSYDVLFLYSTPPTNGLVGGLLRVLKKKPFVYNLHDVFPDSMVEGGMTTEGSAIYKIGRVIENYTYKHSDRIVVLSNGIKQNLIHKNVPNQKIRTVFNWADDKAVVHVQRSENTLFREFALDEDKFIVTYAGNIGVAQGVDVIVKAAEKLKDNSDILFVIIGNGAKEQDCREMAKELNNVQFFPMQDISRLSEVYSLGDASIVTCKKGFGKCGMPSKTVNIMAAETALIATFDSDSDLANMIKKNNCGICVEPEKAALLAESIEWLSHNRGKCLEYGKNGRKYVATALNKDKCITELIGVVNEVI